MEQNIAQNRRQQGAHHSPEGYFTVEAAMVLPMVMMIIVWMLYLLFFQYDRCLLEQDMGVLALRGATLQADNNEERLRLLREEADNLYWEKYIAWESGKIELKLEHGQVSVKQNAEIKFPFGRAGFASNVWKTTTDCESHVLSPVSFIRSYEKITGGQ